MANSHIYIYTHTHTYIVCVCLYIYTVYTVYLGMPELICIGRQYALFWCVPKEVTQHVPVTLSAPLFVNSGQMLSVQMRRRAELFS